MNAVGRIIVTVAGVLGGAAAAQAAPVTYDFTGTGTVCTYGGVGMNQSCASDQTFTGTITFDVLAASPSGPDAGTDGSTYAYDSDDWVKSDFVIQWNGNTVSPAPLPDQVQAVLAAEVYNDYLGEDSMFSGELYMAVGSTGLFTSSWASLLRKTADTSWLSGVSFDATAGLAPGIGAVNDIAFEHYSSAYNAATKVYDYTGFTGNFSLVSLAPHVEPPVVVEPPVEGPPVVDPPAVTPPAVVTVDLVVRPGSINPKSRGLIPVVLLTTSAFDAAMADPGTIRFGRTGTEAAPVHLSFEDVDGDGDIDLSLHFGTAASGIQCGDTAASFAGQTFGGQPLQGSDSFRTVGCR